MLLYTNLLIPQGLTDVEQRLELELLRLSRALDRERLVELLKATDPDPPSPKSKVYHLVCNASHRSVVTKLVHVSYMRLLQSAQ
jgi:hypothetical protein